MVLKIVFVHVSSLIFLALSISFEQGGFWQMHPLQYLLQGSVEHGLRGLIEFSLPSYSVLNRTDLLLLNISHVFHAKRTKSKHVFTFKLNRETQWWRLPSWHGLTQLPSLWGGTYGWHRDGAWDARLAEKHRLQRQLLIKLRSCW